MRSELSGRRRSLPPPRVLVLTLGVLVGTGTVLLRLPTASEGEPLALVDAFFTATSAVCVTGLIVVDTPTGLSTFGEITVLLLIQLGGLGYMTIATLAGMSLGRRLTLQERRVLQEGLQADTLEGVGRFTAIVLGVTVCFELAGAAALTFRWIDEFGLARAAYLGLFHSVSAFNNAGFSLFSTNLVAYRTDVIVNLVVLSLVVSGGLGFLVLLELGQRRRWHRLSLHTKLVVGMTAVLTAAGTVVVFLLERGNPNTLGGLPLDDAWLVAVFQAVTPRTAGFNTVDIQAMTAPSIFILMTLMFIGAGPGSTGGGVKVSTIAVTIVALWATIRGVREPSVFGRRLAPELVSRAFLISLFGLLTVNVATGGLLVLEDGPFLATVFEATSAFGTVGLSTGAEGRPVSLAGDFTPAGKLLIATMMFAGRLGPLTLAVALAGRENRPRYRYPEGKVQLG